MEGEMRYRFFDLMVDIVSAPLWLAFKMVGIILGVVLE
jgi:hypothetical protein